MITFKQFLSEITGWQSHDWAVGAHIPSVNLAGVTSNNTSDPNYIRGGYGVYDQPQNASVSSLGNYRDEIRKGVAQDIKQMGIPTTEKSGTIKHIDDKKNPIMIYMSDGTRLFLSLDDYRNIGSPSKGKQLTVTLQRRPEDGSMSTSSIRNVKVH